MRWGNAKAPYYIPKWDSKCCNKLRVFTWLLLMDRLNTRNILKRKKQKLEGDNYNCVLCNRNMEETTFSSLLRLSIQPKLLAAT